jgi:hypothetical protein
MIISKGGTGKKHKKTSCPYAIMKKIKKGDGRIKISYPCMKLKISKRGTQKRKKNIMSLCENENLKKGDGRKNKNILSLYENENLKKGDGKKQTCPYAKMKKVKKGDGQKNPSYPCIKMKISKEGTEKKKEKKYYVPMQK